MRLAFAFYLLRNVLLSLNNDASCPGCDLGMKVTEMLVVSLRVVNCRFWSHVRFQDRKPIFLLILQVSVRVDYERKLKIYDNQMTLLLKSNNNNNIQHSM